MRSIDILVKVFKKSNIPNIIFYLLGCFVLIYFYGFGVFWKIVLFISGVFFLSGLLTDVYLLIKREISVSDKSLYIDVGLSLVLLPLIVFFLPTQVLIYVACLSLIVNLTVWFWRGK